MKFEFLSSENIIPQGWIKKQLETQAAGLNGNLDKVWKDIYDSKWLGGNGEGWERLPYFLDGFVPLAYLLRDGDMIARAQKLVNALIKRQADGGGFYPVGSSDAGDIWAQFLILKMLTVYADCSKDDSIENHVYRGLKFIDTHINCHPLHDWSAARWFECIIPIIWIYRRKKENWLIRLARRLKVHGLDYESAVPLWDETHDEWSHDTHVVNISMALKSDAVFSEITGSERTGLAERMVEKLFKYHGTAYSHFTGDECLSGTSPSQGSELCGVVEAMYSYEWLAAVTGEAKWGDLLEGLAFNALPATVSTDMWTHQYDQQVNQIACVKYEKPVFRTNNGEANMFGLEPNFGCCTANFGQGFPKFALSAYMKKGSTLVILSPVPSQIRFDGGCVEVRSEYPFENKFRIYSGVEREIELRVPEWAKPTCNAAHRIENGWLKLRAPAAKEVEIEFCCQPRLERRHGGRCCLKYGALLFALPVKGEMRKLEYERDGVERKFPYCDYSITPVGEWRYAFASEKFTINRQSYGLPFDRERPPIVITATLAPVEWDYERGYDLVASATAGTVRRGKDVTLNLQPYGATYLRITEMALLK